VVDLIQKVGYFGEQKLGLEFFFFFFFLYKF